MEHFQIRSRNAIPDGRFTVNSAITLGTPVTVNSSSIIVAAASGATTLAGGGIVDYVHMFRDNDEALSNSTYLATVSGNKAVVWKGKIKIAVRNVNGKTMYSSTDAWAVGSGVTWDGTQYTIATVANGFGVVTAYDSTVGILEFEVKS